MPQLRSSHHRPHLLVALSPHGYGHAAMTAPVVAELRRRRPELRLTLQTALPLSWLETRYERPFDLIPEIPDFGLRMVSATEVKVEESAEAYRTLHDRLGPVIEAEAARLAALRPDLMLANIPYVSLLAARRAGLPAIALCCLNWADIYGHYCGHRPEAARIQAEMLEGYAGAQVFLRPEPTLPMERLSNTRLIGPLARPGQAQPERLRRELGAAPGERIGLIGFGGMESGLNFADWPRLPGWRWVVAGAPAGHPALVPLERVGMGFTDILCSADLAVGKPGYGMFAEAGVNGVPMLYQTRPDWPETPFLTAWLERHSRCRAISIPEMFDSVSLEGHLRLLLSQPPKPPAAPTGVDEAVKEILARL